jgi:fatty-acyl-CoA synthase
VPAGDAALARPAGPGAPHGWALFRQIEAMAETRPDAFAEGGITYRRLLDASLTLAGYMQQRLGVRAGDTVLLLVQDRGDLAIAACATARCGAVAVMTVPEASAAGVQVAIAGGDALPVLAPLLDDGSLYGCIVCAEAVSARPGVHDFADALSAGIAPVPLPASDRSGPPGVVF